MKKELVLAIYDKNYIWINSINDNVRITRYNKNINNVFDGETILMPNVGRDVHTFFYHIFKNYNSLSDYTFFSQDFPFDHVVNYIEIINGDKNLWDKYAKLKIGGCWFFETSWNRILTCDKRGLPHHPKGELHIEDVWNKLFETPIPDEINFVSAGHFCASKSQIRKNTKSFYKKIVEILSEDPISPWIIERLESYIFDDRIIKKI